MEQEIRKKRQVKFELLRILCMYMIVIGHCLFHGRVTAKLGYGTVNYFLSYLIQSFSVVHVNCFVMIGGYFAIDRAFKAERAVKLWKQVAFYSVGIFLLCAMFGSIAPVDVVKAVLPISSKTYWFASVYMGLLLLMPFLGMVAVRITRKQYQYLLFLLALFLSVNHMIFRTDTYGTFNGRDLPGFIFLALLAGYIKLHMREDRKYVRKGLAGYVICSLAVLASVYLSVKMGLEDTGYFLNYNSPLALLATFSIFVAVRNMPWKESRLDGLILKVSGAAFGVYLIHDNYLIRYLVWDTFRASKVARTHWAVIYAVVAAVIVYIVCTCVELLRQRLFKAVGTCYGKTGCYRKEQKLCEKINFMLFENDTNQEDKNERI